MLTPLGWWTAGGSVVLYGVGWWLGYPEPAAVGGAGLLAVVFGLLVTVPTPKLKVSRDIAPLKVPRGEPAVGVLKVRSMSRAVVVPGLTVRDVIVPADGAASSVRVAVL
ncbi:hypothetical protein ACFQ07_12845, partial [Actinomadura adrarensis]